MSKGKIMTMPGDGVGKVVLEQAIGVITATGFEAEYIHADFMTFLPFKSRLIV